MLKKLATNPLVYLFKTNWKYAEGNQKKIVMFWVMFIAANAIDSIIQPLIYAKIINVITLEGITNESIITLFSLLAAVIVVELAFWSFHGPARLIERENAFLSRIGYRKFLLRGIMNLPMQWHTDHHSGDTIDKLEKGASALFGFSESSFEVIKSIVELAICYVMLVKFSPSSIFIVTFMLLVNALITIRFDKVLVPQYKELNRSENSITESVFDSISNISTVIVLRVERLVFEAIVHKLEKPLALFKLNIGISEIKWFLTSICIAIMSFLVLGMYFWNHLGAKAGVLVGSVYLLMNYLDKMGNLFFRFTGMYSDVVRRRTSVENAEELSVDFISGNLTNHVLPQDWQKLEINNLTFSYKGGDKQNLDNISLGITRGKKIAVVGESGGGKTTFLKVMRDLYSPENLTLSVDGKVIPDGFAGICLAISLVPQNPEIFATTIMANITLGAEYTMEDTERFARAACFYDVACALPKKFDSSIKEKGVNLSGGQRQRLALTRGLIASSDKEIILLDEPTSSLDKLTEVIVYNNIFREFHGKTIIATIHNLQLLSLFDEIHMFEDGKIVGSGTLQELLVSCPQFIHLWNTTNISTENE